MGYKKKTWSGKLHDNKSFPKIIDFKHYFPCAKAL